MRGGLAHRFGPRGMIPMVAPGAHERGGVRHPLRVFVAALLIVLGVLFLYSFRYIALGALVGLMIGVLPEPVIRWLRDRWHVPRGLAALMIGGLALAAAVGLGFAVYATVVPQLESLARQGPAIIKRLNEYKTMVMDGFSRFGLNMQQLDIAAMAQGSAQLLMKGLSVGIEGIAGILVVLMIGLFVAVNYETYAKGARSAFPPDVRPRVESLAGGATRVLRRWFVGQMVVVMITGALTAVTMLLIGMDYWLVVAALTIVLDFVPFIGAVVTGAIAVALTLGTEPDKAIWVLIAFIVIQQIESDVVLPIVMKGTIRLPEAHLLVFVVVLGSAFGVLGVFVAPPLFAVLHYLYREGYVPWIEQRASGST